MTNLCKGKYILKEDVILMKTSRDLQMFASLAQLVEWLSLETLLTLKVEKSLICLVDTRRSTVSIIEQQTIILYDRS
jgi:hypothetical protein